MDITFEYTGTISLVLLTGLSAGLCFTWSNAVTPGIGKLDDLGYLRSFQKMNKAILNPIFFIVFFGPSLLGPINLYHFSAVTKSIMGLFTIAIALYLFGVVLITILGNVPLNNILDTTDLNSKEPEELKILRDIFEVKWNRLHLIRTVSAIISFLLLLIGLIQITKIKL